MAQVTLESFRRDPRLRVLLWVELLMLWALVPLLILTGVTQGFRAGVLQDDDILQACSSVSVSFGDALTALVSRELQGCTIPASANTWRGLAAIGGLLLVCGIVTASAVLLRDGPVTIGPADPGDVVAVIGWTLLALAVLSIAAVALFINLFWIAALYMIGIVGVCAASGTRD